MNRSAHVCPPWISPFLDNPIRRWLLGSRRLASEHVAPGMTVLDFGCGPAPMLVDFARALGTTGRIVCADLQQSMLSRVARKARRRGLSDRVELHLCDPGAGLSLPADSIDFAVAFWVMHELPRPADALGQILSCLKSGGRFLLVEPTIHVSRDKCLELVQAARDTGFAAVSVPRIRLSRAQLLQKP